MLLLRVTFRRKGMSVTTVFLELAALPFFFAVGFFGTCFFATRLVDGTFLAEVGLDFVAFLPFFLVAIFAVYHRQIP